jgi:carbon monoxide dehydrogenase subunit G
VNDPFHGKQVASVTHQVAASPAEVWSVLADGWLYATWVVGASRIRAVEPGWPAAGAKVHHSFGVWPLVINDDTTVLSATPERELVLRAKGWPAGEATVRLVLTAAGDHTVVTVQEDATAGPGRLLPKPVRQLGVLPRNKESLRRLAFLAEGRRPENTGQ